MKRSNGARFLSISTPVLIHIQHGSYTNSNQMSTKRPRQTVFERSSSLIYVMHPGLLSFSSSHVHVAPHSTCPSSTCTRSLLLFMSSFHHGTLSVSRKRYAPWSLGAVLVPKSSRHITWQALWLIGTRRSCLMLPRVRIPGTAIKKSL